MKENAVKKVIGLSGATQTEVAKKMNLAQCTISEHSNKNVIGTFERSLKIAEKLGVKGFKLTIDNFVVSVECR